MKTTHTLLTRVAMASCLLFAGTAMAQMAPTEFNASKTRIKNGYSTAKKA